MISNLTGLEEESLWVAMPQAINKKKRHERRQEDAKILRMRANGLKDHEIAERIINPKTGKPYHPKSINRRIRQILDRQKIAALRG